MAKFIDIDDPKIEGYPRTLINVDHIVLIERSNPNDENSPVRIFLTNGEVFNSNKPFSKYKELLDD